jgi:ABC-type polysaccharide/polyol phosphate export permease
MMYAGLASSGILGVILGRSNSLQPNSAFTDLFIPPIAILTGMLSIGVISGCLAYITTYSRKLHIILQNLPLGE